MVMFLMADCGFSDGKQAVGGRCGGVVESSSHHSLSRQSWSRQRQVRHESSQYCLLALGVECPRHALVSTMVTYCVAFVQRSLLKCSDAVERRDNIAATLYEQLFDYIVRHINDAIADAAQADAARETPSRSTAATASEPLQFNVVDGFGFEDQFSSPATGHLAEVRDTDSRVTSPE